MLLRPPLFGRAAQRRDSVRVSSPRGVICTRLSLLSTLPVPQSHSPPSTHLQRTTTHLLRRTRAGESVAQVRVRARHTAREEIEIGGRMACRRRSKASSMPGHPSGSVVQVANRVRHTGRAEYEICGSMGCQRRGKSSSVFGHTSRSHLLILACPRAKTRRPFEIHESQVT